MDTVAELLGEPTIDSQLRGVRFIDEDERVLLGVSVDRVRRDLREGNEPDSFLKAGPRKRIYFDPSEVGCALVTCGGLCPGMNNVIRSVVMTLHHGYGVRKIVGIRYGLQGFIPSYGHPVLKLDADTVSEINELGGTILSSSRGPRKIEEVVDSLERMNIGILFMMGGDGTFRAAERTAGEIRKRGAKIGVIGIPKTIDNDINLVSRSFGFSTAVSIATQAIGSAHVEATGAPNGVGLVKLMGRHSGFIAASAALAKRHANLVLIPECDFEIEGPHGLLQWLEKRLEARGHAVIVAAEGAGQKYCTAEGIDASGNPRLGDIGLRLKDIMVKHFRDRGIELNLKYIDPSYMIRSVPANAEDSVYCGFLGQIAVHEGMAGKTNMVVGTWNEEFVCIPITAVVKGRKQVDPDDKLWRSVLEVTGQPPLSEGFG